MSALTAAVLMALLTVMGAGTASADGNKPARAVQAPMTVDCVHLDDQARNYAVTHNICTPDGKPVQPAGVREGNCGTSWIWIFDSAYGEADIDYGFASNLGPAISRSLSVGYAGSDDAGGFNDNSLMFSSSYSGERQDIPVGYGDAYTSMGGTITLAWGAQCTLLQPADSTWIG